MNVSQVRSELRRMKKGDLFRLASEQKISQCMVGAKCCSFFLRYREFFFCLSELLGEGCIYERSQKVKHRPSEKEKSQPSLPWTKVILNGFSRAEIKGIEFSVYWRDEATRTITLLGKTVERRMEERVNNLRDLLTKARKEFSDQVSNPNFIFLLGP